MIASYLRPAGVPIGFTVTRTAASVATAGASRVLTAPASAAFAPIVPIPSQCLDLSRPPGEISDSRSAEDVFDRSRPYVTRIYRRRFRVTTSHRFFGAGLVREAAKQYLGLSIGQPYQIGVPGDPWYEYDPLSFVTRLSVTAGVDACDWVLDVNYEPIDPAEIAAFESPLLAAWELEIDGVKYQEVADYDMDATALAAHSYTHGNAILNSANDPFDPPVKRDATRTVFVIKRNEALDVRQAIGGVVFDDTIPETYRDTINSTTFLGRAARRVKCEDIRARYVWHPSLYDPTASPPLPGLYAEVTYTFAVHPITWDERVFDAGYRTWDTTSTPHRQKTIILNGVPATSPVPLDGSGQIAPRDPLTEKIIPTFLTFRLYREYDFAADLKIS